MLRPWAPEFAATGDGLRRSLNGLIRSALGRFELEHSWNVEFATSVNVGVQAQSSCKFVRLVFPNTMRSSTSINQANGLRLFSFRRLDQRRDRRSIVAATIGAGKQSILAVCPCVHNRKN